jgi:hypothetical protein
VKVTAREKVIQYYAQTSSTEPPHRENLLKQEVNNQRKHRAVTRNKEEEEEEEYSPSHRKICKEIQLDTVIQDQSNNWGIRTITGPMVGYQKI